jgi:hypothetical protein
MRPTSQWLTQLKAQEPEACAHCLAFYSTHDNLVLPFEHGKWVGNEAILLSGLGHVSLLFDRSTARLISQHALSFSHT